MKMNLGGVFVTKNIDWNEIKKWDEEYIIRTWASSEEYHCLPIESTDGDYLIMPDGTRLLDFFNQLYCVNAGQKNPYINAKIKESLDRYGFLWDAFTSDYKAQAAKLIIEDILGPDNWAKKIRFTSSGSEANEMAMIIARLFTGKPTVVTREHSYNGYTAAASSVTQLKPVKSGLSTSTPGDAKSVPGLNPASVLVTPAPYCYQCSLGQTYPACKTEGEMLPCVKATEKLILNQGVEHVAAMITEISFGAATIHPPAEYIPQIREMTKELGIVWIVDEVLTGFGRMGSWFAYQNYDVVPDIMTVAKGISSSGLPAGAVIVNEEIAKFLDSHRWNHVSTFSGHPIAMAAVVGNIEYMLENNLPEKAKQSGEYMGARLRELQSKHKSVGLVAGSGQLWQVELVKNRETKELFVPADRNTDFTGDLSKSPNNIIKYKAIEKGVLIGGFVPNTLRIGASLEISNQDIDKGIDALDYALTHLDTLAD